MWKIADVSATVNATPLLYYYSTHIKCYEDMYGMGKSNATSKCVRSHYATISKRSKAVNRLLGKECLDWLLHERCRCLVCRCCGGSVEILDE